jgi:hypothetical protein
VLTPPLRARSCPSAGRTFSRRLESSRGQSLHVGPGPGPVEAVEHLVVPEALPGAL